MAYMSAKDDNLNYFKDNNHKQLNLLDEKEPNIDNSSTNIMLNKMNELISTIQQLQKMFIDQPSTQLDRKTHQSKEITLEKQILPPSQTEILLQQVQNAMKSTIAQLSNRSSDKEVPSFTEKNKMTDDVKELSISEKWKLYTEMYQSKHESSKVYCLNKMKLGQELGLNFKDTKREMLIGLWSNRLAVVLYLKQHETENDLLNEIEEWEKIESARSDVFKKYRNKNVKNNL